MNICYEFATKTCQLCINVFNGALWDSNGGRVILNKHRMPASETGSLCLFANKYRPIQLKIVKNDDSRSMMSQT